MKAITWAVGIFCFGALLFGYALWNAPPDERWSFWYVAVLFGVIVGVGLWLGRKSQ